MGMAYVDDDRPQAMQEKKRIRLVDAALNRLETLAESTDELVAQLRASFNPVVFHEEVPQVSTREDNGKDRIPGSDLGQAMSSIADRLENGFRNLRELAESSDL